MGIVGSKINSPLTAASVRVPLWPPWFSQPDRQFVRGLIPAKGRGMIKRGRHFMRHPSVLMHHSNERPILMVPVRIQYNGIEHEIAGHLPKGHGLFLRIGEYMRNRSQNIFDRVVALAKLLGTIVPKPGSSQ